MTRRRLDQCLVDARLASSRMRARALIHKGAVYVNARPVYKPAKIISIHDKVQLCDMEPDFVSRAAGKLLAGLAHFDVSPAAKTCLDLGASTGGFTQILRQKGAEKVYAVDVGHGQLHDTIRQDPGVIVLEKTHAKDLTRAHIPDPVAFFTCDISFISLRKAIAPSLALCDAEAEAIILIKPQFELGPDYIGKGGRVKADEHTLHTLCNDVACWMAAQGWQSRDICPSPILGSSGNKEFLLSAKKL